jgi:hypothetical protein
VHEGSLAFMKSLSGRFSKENWRFSSTKSMDLLNKTNGFGQLKRQFCQEKPAFFIVKSAVFR